MGENKGREGRRDLELTRTQPYTGSFRFHALRNRELALVTPELWADRFEVLPRRVIVIVDKDRFPSS